MWKKLQHLLIEKEMSQRELARRTGISPNTIGNIKKKKISFEKMVKIADALDVSLDEFREEKQHGNHEKRIPQDETAHVQ